MTPAHADVRIYRDARTSGQVTRSDWTGTADLRVSLSPGDTTDHDMELGVFMTDKTTGAHTSIVQDGGYPSEYHQKGLRWGHLTMTLPDGCLYQDGECQEGLLEVNLRWDGFGPRTVDESPDSVYTTRACVMSGRMLFDGEVILRGSQIQPQVCTLDKDVVQV